MYMSSMETLSKNNGTLGEEIKEFRCPSCNRLLFKGDLTPASHVEIKCRRCHSITNFKGRVGEGRDNETKFSTG